MLKSNLLLILKKNFLIKRFRISKFLYNVEFLSLGIAGECKIKIS